MISYISQVIGSSVALPDRERSRTDLNVADLPPRRGACERCLRLAGFRTGSGHTLDTLGHALRKSGSSPFIAKPIVA